MDSHLVLTGFILFSIWYLTSKNSKNPFVPYYPIGPVVNPNGPVIPSQPVNPVIVPVSPHRRPLKGACFGVTDKAFGPFTPNVKNPCPNNTYGWNLINNPTTNQCKYYVGPEYTSGLGGCFIPNQPGGAKTLFLLINSGP